MNKQLKVIQDAKNCTLYEGLTFPSEVSCVKTALFNAVLGRMELKHTQEDVSAYLGISVRSVIELEKGKSNNLTMVLKYVNRYAYNFAKKKLEQSRVKYYTRK